MEDGGISRISWREFRCERHLLYMAMRAMLLKTVRSLYSIMEAMMDLFTGKNRQLILF